MRTTLAALALLALAGCGGTESSTSSSSTEATSQTATADGLALTLDPVEVTDAIAGLPDPSAGETYVVARYTVANTGKKPMEIADRPKVDLVDGDGQVYSPDLFGSTFLAASGDPSGSGSATNPGTSVKLAQVWKIAKNGFDASKWKIVARTKPEHEFKLN